MKKRKTKKKTFFFDTSKYISLRLALALAIASLIICILVGIKYTDFNEMLRTQVFGPVSFFENVEEPILTTEDCLDQLANCYEDSDEKVDDCVQKANFHFAECTLKPKKPGPDECGIDLALEMTGCNNLKNILFESCNNQHQACLDLVNTPSVAPPTPDPFASTTPMPTTSSTFFLTPSTMPSPTYSTTPSPSFSPFPAPTTTSTTMPFFQMNRWF